VIDSINHGDVHIYKDQLYFYKGYATLDYRLSFYTFSQMSYKSLRPKWGFSYYITQQNPNRNKQYWSNSRVQFLTAYLPGLFRHHSLKVQLSFEDGFSQRLSPARGYSSTDTYYTYNSLIFTSYSSARKLSFDYAFPLLYPNLSLGPIAYFKRVRANIFYDNFKYTPFAKTNIGDLEFTDNLESVGAEIAIETNLLRFFWTFVPTFRYSYRLEDGVINTGFFITTQYGFSLGKIKNGSQHFANHW
jgi:hypothetical protein